MTSSGSTQRFSWRTWLSAIPSAASPRGLRRRRRRGLPPVELLEDRSLLSSTLPITGLNWTEMGPDPIKFGQTPGREAVSGRITSIAANPTDPKTILVGAAGGGLWKTADGGVNWTPLTDSQSTLAIGSITFAPSNSNIIYVGTGEANNSLDSQYGRGVLRSIDGGQSWVLTGNSVFDRKTISKVVVDPINPNIVYVALGQSFGNGILGGTGVWKSLDAGATWTNMTNSATSLLSTNDAYSDLIIDPSDNTHLYTAIGTYFGSPNNGVYQTHDSGATWTKLNTIFAGFTDGRYSLAISSADPNRVALTFSDSTTFGVGGFGVQISLNGGQTWNQTTFPPNYMGTQGWYDQYVAFSPSDPNTLFVAGSANTNSVLEYQYGQFGSFTTFGTWTDISTGGTKNVANGPHADHHAVAFDALGRLLDGNDGGIWRLDDPTPTAPVWTDLNGNLGTIQFTGIALNPIDPNIAYGGSQDNGTEKFFDNSTTPANVRVWTHIQDGDGGFVRVDPVNPDTVYHTFYYGPFSFLERSDDGGKTWNGATTGINLTDPSLPADDDPAHFYPPYIIDPGNHLRLLLGTNRVYESLDQGKTWAPISTINKNGWTTASPIDAVAASKTSPSTIYASAGGHVYATFDHGATWLQRDPVKFPPAQINYNDIKVDPVNPLMVYVVASNFSDKTGGGHVFKSGDGGATWIDISAGLPDLPVNGIVLKPAQSNSIYLSNVLYVATDAGVYKAQDLDNSTVWAPTGQGLPNAQAVGLDIMPNLGIVGVATHGRGMWELGLDTAPTLNGIGQLTTIAGNQSANFTYTDLLQQSGAVDAEKDIIRFRIENVTNGILTVNGQAAVNGITVVQIGDILSWTPFANQINSRVAFSMRALDSELLSNSVPVAIQITPANLGPNLTVVNPLAGAHKNLPFPIAYATLLASSDLSDLQPGSSPYFVIGGVNASAGMLTKAGNPVVTGTPFMPGETLIWTPTTGLTGTATAFSVFGSDGTTLTSTPVDVTIQVVNDLPTIVQGPAIAGGAAGAPVSLTYADVLKNTMAADVNMDAIQFRIENVVNGSLTNNGQPVVPGTTLVSSGDTLVWTPPPNLTGPQPAFAIRAFDGTAFSADSVQVLVAVAGVNHPPVLTVVNTLGVNGLGHPAIKNQPFAIDYTTLVGMSDLHDPDLGQALSFIFTSVTNGSLSINGVPVVPGVTQLSTGQTVTWTPLPNLAGVLPAYTVVATDGQLTSSPPVQVNINVINVAPTLSRILPFQATSQNGPVLISYNDLLSHSDANSPSGDPISFRIESVVQGSLTKNGVSVTPGLTAINAGENLVWTPPGTATGLLDAFVVRAENNLLLSDKSATVRVGVPFTNHPPTLTTIGPLTGGLLGGMLQISYSQLKGASDLADADPTQVLSFRIESVLNGSATVNGIAVQPGVTLLGPNDVLTYTPPAGVVGNIAAFTVRGFDGSTVSATPVTVTVGANVLMMFRAYNPNVGIHFFTTSAVEFHNGLVHGLIDETTGRASWGVANDGSQGAVPLHRLRNPNNALHYLTPSDGERDFLVRVGWIFEHEEGFIYLQQVPGTTQIFNLYNSNSGEHLFTDSVGTRNAILQQFPGIWFEHTPIGFGFSIGVNSSLSSASPSVARLTSAAVVQRDTSTTSSGDALSRTGATSGLASGVTGGPTASPAAAHPAPATASTVPASTTSAAAPSSQILDTLWNHLGQQLLTGKSDLAG